MQRDEFSEQTKRALAERVAWKCSFPGCNVATVGPNADPNKSTRLGEAAHITAAAPGGPRFDSQMTSEQRKHISNGIWMCKHHARLVDADELNYSVSTLQQWKIMAERRAYEALEQNGESIAFPDTDTLVALGLRIVFKGLWLSGGGNLWRFRCLSFVRGNQNILLDEIASSDEKFIVVESQGDGRKISGPITWQSIDGNFELTIPVHPRTARQDPESSGLDIALGPDGDLLLENGDLTLISGTDKAIQSISIVMGAVFGEDDRHPNMGSLATLYYHRYSADRLMFARLLKLEIARKATISMDDRPPSLNTIWRVNDVAVPSLALTNNRLAIEIDLEWCNHKRWKGIVNIYIHSAIEIIPERFRQ